MSKRAVNLLRRRMSPSFEGAMPNSAGVKLLAAGANTLTAEDSGKTIVFNVAAATTVTLPAPRLGMKFHFITTITATGDHEIIAATNDHGFLGGVNIVSTTAAKAAAFSAATDGNNDYITMNGGTTGGAAGGHLWVVALLDASAAKCWGVGGTLNGVGSTMATPFADA